MLPALSLALYYLYLFSILFVREAEATDFNDLGKMLLGEFALAIAVSFVIVKLPARSPPPDNTRSS